MGHGIVVAIHSGENDKQMRTRIFPGLLEVTMSHPRKLKYDWVFGLISSH